MSLNIAAMSGNLEQVRRLINRGADIHAEDDLALIYAAKNGQFLVVEFLVNHGANIHARNDQALIEATTENYLPLVEFLIDHGAPVPGHAQNDQALIYAVYNRNIPVIEYLLTQGPQDYINVLSLKQRKQYQYLVPQVIPIQEYYQLESIIERIQESHNRYILSTTGKTYILPKL